MNSLVFILILIGVTLSVNGQGFYGWPHRRPSGGSIPPWCPSGSPRIYCFVNPCDVETCPAVPWAVCINDNPCEPSCIGNFYFRGRRISRRRCQRVWRRD